MSGVKFDALLGQIREKDTFATSLKLKDTNNHWWVLSVTTDGNLVTTDITTQLGKPMGLLLTITYPA